MSTVAIHRGMAPLPPYVLMGRPTGFMGAPDPSTDNTRAVPAGTTVDYFFPKIQPSLSQESAKKE